jgi:hypothetical protein
MDSAGFGDFPAENAARGKRFKIFDFARQAVF